MGGVSLHGVASATNIESASWAYTSSAANVSYYIQMPPSPPRLDRAACVATSMGGVSLHGVASATNIKSASWSSTSSASNASYDIKIVTVASPSRPCCLRRHINGRSESPRRGERHQRRVRELSSTSSAANVSYYTEMSPSPPRVRGDAYVAASMAEVSLHGVASATNIESASWSSTSSAANVSYYIQMPLSPPRLDRAACVATSMGGVSLHGVASATNIESASYLPPAAPQTCRTTSKCHRRLPVSTVLLASPHQWVE
ncbi:hypothetical protein PF003_g41016 [Phytophthora fragariae]|nr:hypothetical protein PF003_g41016 [Phytophthora fragariae]